MAAKFSLFLSFSVVSFISCYLSQIYDRLQLLINSLFRTKLIKKSLSIINHYLIDRFNKKVCLQIVIIRFLSFFVSPLFEILVCLKSIYLFMHKLFWNSLEWIELKFEIEIEIGKKFQFFNFSTTTTKKHT